MPTFYRKLDNLLKPNDRFRELASWRKAFKKEWKRCAITPISDPDDLKYNPNPERWVCTCRAFLLSRFLLCKHLVQSVEAVLPTFFQEVRRARTAPFWPHPSLKQRADAPLAREGPAPILTPARQARAEISAGRLVDDDESDGDDNVTAGLPAGTHQERLLRIVSTLRDFTDGVAYQQQFSDARFVRTLEREGARLLRLADDCLELERLSNRSNTLRPNTWSGRCANTMYYRTRPPVHNRS